MTVCVVTRTISVALLLYTGLVLTLSESSIPQSQWCIFPLFQIPSILEHLSESMKIVPNLPFSKEILYLSTKISDDIFPCLSAKISFVSHWLPIFYFPICFRKIDYIPLFHKKCPPISYISSLCFLNLCVLPNLHVFCFSPTFTMMHFTGRPWSECKQWRSSLVRQSSHRTVEVYSLLKV